MTRSNGGNKSPSQRQLRVGELVRHALTDLLQRGEIEDPALVGKFISITEVKMSPDLKIATAYFSAFGVEDTSTIAKALANHQKRIRGKLSPVLRQMKYMPQFRFLVDNSFDNYDRIDKLLHSPGVMRDIDPKS